MKKNVKKCVENAKIYTRNSQYLTWICQIFWGMFYTCLVINHILLTWLQTFPVESMRALWTTEKVFIVETTNLEKEEKIVKIILYKIFICRYFYNLILQKLIGIYFPLVVFILFCQEKNLEGMVVIYKPLNDW